MEEVTVHGIGFTEEIEHQAIENFFIARLPAWFRFQYDVAHRPSGIFVVSASHCKSEEFWLSPLVPKANVIFFIPMVAPIARLSEFFPHQIVAVGNWLALVSAVIAHADRLAA